MLQGLCGVFGIKKKIPDRALFITERLHNKRLFRRHLSKISGIYSPWHYEYGIELNPNEFNSFPVLFKPDHAGGGRGICQINNEIEYIKFSKDNSPDAVRGIIEEVVEGNLYSISLWLKQGKPIFFYGEREFVNQKIFRVNGSVSSNHIQSIFIELKIPEILSEILSEFEIYDGFCHTQIMISGSGSWKIIESMLRFPGDMYSYNVDNFGALPYSSYYLDTFNKKSGFDKVRKKIYPTESTYGRVMLKKRDQLKDFIVPFAEFRSHKEDHNDLYRILFFKTGLDLHNYDEFCVAI